MSYHILAVINLLCASLMAGMYASYGKPLDLGIAVFNFGIFLMSNRRIN